MPYIATFKALKKRAKAIDPASAKEIEETHVRNVSRLIDRYPQIVPSKYSNCHVESFVDAVREWVVELDADRARKPEAESAAA
jgi:ribosomal silencing factor RsfS